MSHGEDRSFEMLRGAYMETNDSQNKLRVSECPASARSVCSASRARAPKLLRIFVTILLAGPTGGDAQPSKIQIRIDF